MTISTLLHHTQRAAGIKTADMISLLRSADIYINANTLAKWRNGEREPVEVRQIKIRDLCARLHTCERCEGNPPELRPAPKLEKKRRFGVSPTTERGRYNRLHAVMERLLADGETSTKLKADAEAVAAEVPGAVVSEVRGRWRITISAAVEGLAAEETK